MSVDPIPVHPLVVQPHRPTVECMSSHIPPGKASGAPHGMQVDENCHPLAESARQVATIGAPEAGLKPVSHSHDREEVVAPGENIVSHVPFAMTGTPQRVQIGATVEGRASTVPVSAGHPHRLEHVRVRFAP